MPTIRALQKADYPRLQAIYQQGIEWGEATFETEIKTWQVWDEMTAKAARLVAILDNEVIGWACLSEVTSRCVYRGVAETSIYVDNKVQGQGVGTALLQALIEASEAAGYWTLQARIFPENPASIAIHQKLGFEILGLHKNLAKLNGVWRDVQLLERRSKTVGLD